MKYFIIKEHYTPTEKNKKGFTEQNWYVGKGLSNILTDYDWAGNGKNNTLCTWLVAKYGYTRMCDAKRVLNRVKELNAYEIKAGWWNINSEIIEVEV